MSTQYAGSQPTDLKYEIEGYKVKLKWHFHPSEHNPVERFYITIQEQKGGSKMGPPDYIQVPSSERRVSIVGLQQYRTYNLTVRNSLVCGINITHAFRLVHIWKMVVRNRVKQSM